MNKWIISGIIAAIVFLFFFFESSFGLFNCDAGNCGNPFFCVGKTLIISLIVFIIVFASYFIVQKARGNKK